MPDGLAAPSVSVIIATYNSRGSLGFTLQSVLNQDFHDFEVWIIGDACTDDSAQIVASFNDPRLNWFNLPQNTGSQSEPNNEGLRRARGQYIAFIGHDDLWLPWHLSALLKQIEASAADLVHSLCALIGPEGAYDVIGPPHAGVNYDLHFVPPSSWLHRRTLIDEVGFWRSPDTLSLPIDHDFIRRVSLAQKRLEFTPELSVLKFPSAWWKSYASDQAPQAAYLKALIENPAAVRSQALLDLAVAHSRYDRWIGKNTVKVNARLARQSVVNLLRSMGRALIDRYGREHEPLAGLLRWRYRRFRQQLRAARGLPPLK